ncbi:hypothetical protein N9242_04410 [Vicingaceae bacterium]|nr:hypothetical protein [Vicingaceae bacterium]
MKKFHEIKIRIYRAVDNLTACERFAKGHSDVLASYGIKKVTSSSKNWFNDPKVYLIMVESLSGDKTFGGARLHLKNKDFKLPLEEALGHLDSKIFELIADNGEYKTGELCGLWNTKLMSGSGLSVILIRSGVAKAGILIAKKLNIKSLYTLSAPWTIGMVKEIGFTVEYEMGKKGEFEYPNPDLIATVLVLKDIDTLKNAKSNERDSIINLRENPIQKKDETGPKGIIEVEYDLITDENQINII